MSCRCSPSPLPALQMVTALPEIRKETLQPGDEFLLLACDGIWDVLTNQEVGGAGDRGSNFSPVRGAVLLRGRRQRFSCGAAQAWVCARHCLNLPHTPHTAACRLWTLCVRGWQRGGVPRRWARMFVTAASPPTPAAAARAARS